MVVADVLGFVDFPVYVMLRSGSPCGASRCPGGGGSSPGWLWRVIAPCDLAVQAVALRGVHFRMLRVNTRCAEYQACAQQQQR